MASSCSGGILGLSGGGLKAKALLVVIVVVVLVIVMVVVVCVVVVVIVLLLSGLFLGSGPTVARGVTSHEFQTWVKQQWGKADKLHVNFISFVLRRVHARCSCTIIVFVGWLQPVTSLVTSPQNDLLNFLLLECFAFPNTHTTEKH
jgi:hypothetical protein